METQNPDLLHFENSGRSPVYGSVPTRTLSVASAQTAVCMVWNSSLTESSGDRNEGIQGFTFLRANGNLQGMFDNLRLIAVKQEV